MIDALCPLAMKAADSTRAALTCVCLLAGMASTPVLAADVGLAGVFPGKALLTINGGAPRTVAVGSTTAEGVRVLAVDGESATLEVDGRRRALRVGQNVAAQRATEGEKAVLSADGQGHFLTTGLVNGRSMRFLVDTGASVVSLGAGDAARLGIDARNGQPGFANTANGQTPVRRVSLDSVRVGEITLYNVDAIVHEHDLPFALLGMSFLNRMEMQREGSTLTLKKRF
ncbi:retropepsin-like aspartic protease family protein [Rhodocyclus tenuis]|uniref:retropepsin-like aspartic protease family protein n=1 Tax=Rhodocyclus tenuis TaxID=1066 RepID=UPI001F5B05D3|nr:TIGR02281 family clan AA aspartic protease [Rhodocyclus tenuis]